MILEELAKWIKPKVNFQVAVTDNTIVIDTGVFSCYLTEYDGQLLPFDFKLNFSDPDLISDLSEYLELVNQLDKIPGNFKYYGLDDHHEDQLVFLDTVTYKHVSSTFNNIKDLK